MQFSSLLFAAALLFSPVVFADDALQLDLANKPFSPQKDAVLGAVNTNAKYSEITQADLTSIENSLQRIAESLADGKNIASLDAPSRENIQFNQDTVNKLLVKAFRDSKLVCTKEAAIGSNMMKRVCKTAAARSRDNANVRANGIKVNH